MVRMMHIAELKLMKGNKCNGGNRNGKRKQKQEHNYKKQRRNGTMEEEMKERKLMVMNKRRTRHLECGFSKMSVEGYHLKSSQLSQDKT